MKRFSALAAGIIALMALGCAGEGGEGATEDFSVIRAVHAVSDGATLQISIEGASLTSGLSYGEETGFLSVMNGNRRLLVQDGSSTLIDDRFDIPGNYSYTVIAVGTVASPDGILVQNPVLRNNFNGWVRFIQGSLAAGTVDVYIHPTGLALRPSYRVADNIPFQSFTAHTNLTPGNYTVTVRSMDDTTTLFTRDITVGIDTRTSVLLLDAPGGGTPLGSMLLNDSRVRP